MRNQSGLRLPNWAIGLIMVLALAVASYVAFTKQVPWGGGTEFQVTFNSAQNLRPNSPVRVAGVEVGKVTKVEPLSASGDEEAETASSGSAPTGAVVTMEIDEDGLPWKEDANFTLKPRLFLEGNLFVDVQPGSPSSPPVEEGYNFPPSQTQNTVQLDEVLTGAFQADARKNLQIFLDQFGEALIDEGGADSLRTLNKVSPGAYRYTAEVNQAILGQNPHDLSELIFNLDRVIKGLDRNEPALLDLVTNLRITTGSFAAQDAALEEAIQELPSTLDAGTTAFASLNASFPPLRAFAREALPGVRSTPETLEVTTPLLRQLRGLAQPAELRGLVSDLRPAVPNLAQLTRETIPFLKQNRRLASCFNHTILPWANDRVDSTDPTYDASQPSQGRIFEETGYGLAGISGESRSGDANGQYIRVIGGGGTNTVQIPATDTAPATAGLTPLPLLGAMPAIEDSAKTPFKPKEPCENQDPPDLTATGGLPPTQFKTSAPEAPAASSGEAAAIYEDSQDTLTTLGEAAMAAEEDEDDAKKLQRQALEELDDFYEDYGD